MSNKDETLLLKGMAADLIEPIWHAQFYNDAEDYIHFHDPRMRKRPKPEEEIEKILSELSRLKNDLIDEIVEDLIKNNITTIDVVRSSFKTVQKICHERFEAYRRRLWDVVKPEFPSESV